jgi:hypothetical protein
MLRHFVQTVAPYLYLWRMDCVWEVGREGGRCSGRVYTYCRETDRKFCRCQGFRRCALVLVIKVGQSQDRALELNGAEWWAVDCCECVVEGTSWLVTRFGLCRNWQGELWRNFRSVGMEFPNVGMKLTCFCCGGLHKKLTVLRGCWVPAVMLLQDREASCPVRLSQNVSFPCWFIASFRHSRPWTLIHEFLQQRFV